MSSDRSSKTCAQPPRTEDVPAPVHFGKLFDNQNSKIVPKSLVLNDYRCKSLRIKDHGENFLLTP